ncbi:MAG: MoaD/ThiS family protein [Firmicutes bacterium]|nr:MoaD/ThiS family protein [Bacillota bacterium]
MGLDGTEVEVAGAATVGELIDALDRRIPGIRHRLVESDGAIRPHVNIFVGECNARMDGGLALPLDGAGEVWILRAVSGGAAPP